MKKLPNRKSVRLKNYDYSSAGYYYVTICTYDKALIFGEIINNEMKLNEIGQTAKSCWLEIPDHFSNIELDKYIIMPNHLHGILIINKENRKQHVVSLREFGKPSCNSLATIIGCYKAAVTRKTNSQNHINNRTKLWQKNYWEHIIRSDIEIDRIRKYIIDNPAKWATDELNITKTSSESINHI